MLTPTVLLLSDPGYETHANEFVRYIFTLSHALEIPAELTSTRNPFSVLSSSNNLVVRSSTIKEYKLGPLYRRAYPNVKLSEHWKYYANNNIPVSDDTINAKTDDMLYPDIKIINTPSFTGQNNDSFIKDLQVCLYNKQINNILYFVSRNYCYSENSLINEFLKKFHHLRSKVLIIQCNYEGFNFCNKLGNTDKLQFHFDDLLQSKYCIYMEVCEIINSIRIELI